MERIFTLIDKLHQQKTQGASAAHLLFTVQLLQQELATLQAANGAAGRGRVSVTMPVAVHFHQANPAGLYQDAEVPPTDKEVFQLEHIEELPAAEEPEAEAPLPYAIPKPIIYEALPDPRPEAPKAEAAPVYIAQQVYNSAFETVTDVPTLTQYATRPEVQHTLADAKESVNDRLKQARTEVAHTIKEAPVKDLRKAIGINDRFSFVNELFRGDEAAYERSIKTINNFNIYSEAEYWMTRELKFKLAWSDGNETVKHFYSLVRRRFA